MGSRGALKMRRRIDELESDLRHERATVSVLRQEKQLLDDIRRNAVKDARATISYLEQCSPMTITSIDVRAHIRAIESALVRLS